MSETESKTTPVNVKILENILGFLGRVNITGNEAPAFMEAVNYLTSIASKKITD
jgi:hypothetical protein|nr:MAG TPA: hypothetical protein [Bacteriophage sp.]